MRSFDPLVQNFSINDDNPHIFGGRIGAVRIAPQPFPFERGIKECADSAPELIPVLADMPAKHCSTNHTGREFALDPGARQP